MKRTIPVLATLALAYTPVASGAYQWLASRNSPDTSGFTNFGSCASIVYNNGASTIAALNMILSLPSGTLSSTLYEYLYADTPHSGDGGPVGDYAQVKVSPYDSSHARINIGYYNGGTFSSMGTVTVSTHNNMAVKATLRLKVLSAYIDNVLALSVTLPSGSPDYYQPQGSSGGFGGCYGSTITHVDVGLTDFAAPNAVPSGSIGVSSFLNHLDLQWPAATDDANGMGVLEYQILRNGQLIATTTGLSYSDTTVVPDTTYTYTLKVIDYFFNSASTVFTGRTLVVPTGPPYPSAFPEGRRVGVRTTGAYWGTAGENIDVRSGNLSFSVPLVTAKGRTGWSVPFALAYNSQNWRYDTGLNWKFDGDVGYGFGWRLLAGSVTPYWNPDGLTAAYFLFMDSTGAEYRLDQNNGNVWSSKDTVYVYFDANTDILHFRDGTFWYFGCISASTEADAGVMYPTLMQDTNGNQITILYKPASGAGWTNSSARIDKITDVRKTSYTYAFNYNTDTPPHLTGISNQISSGENHTFTYLSNQALASPFDSQSFGTTSVLNTATLLAGTLSFTYNGSGELTRATLPYGGYFAYDYSTAAYSSGKSYREVIRRYLSKDGSTQTTYPFSHEASLGPDVHQFTILDDPGGTGEKYWAFSTSGFTEGLVTQYQGRQLPGPVTKTQSDFTWTQDALGNSYISSTLTTTDPGQTYQAQKKTAQTVDIYGNVTQVQNYDYGNLSTPVRTYNYTYLNCSPYPANYIYNRLTGASVTDGTSNVTLATNVYSCGGSYQPGNLGRSTTPAGVQIFQYDNSGNGNLINVNVNGVDKHLTYDSSTNFAAPTQLTVNSLTQNMSYSSFLGLTNETGPNGDSASISYLNISHPSSTTSKFGAVTNYTYTTNTTRAVINQTTNPRFTRTTLDGLGRTIKSESGTGVGTTTVSQTETEYDSCGCSPAGKLKRTSQPHAPGLAYGLFTWTTYTYDGIGRTVSVQLPDGASTTSYTYQGNVVTVTDPAGNWKKYTSDVLGHLTQVEEPNPSGGSYFTYYTYDLLDHLTQVSMPRPSGTQTRTFNYNNTAYLQSATNPENGTVAYTYDSNMRLATKTDAKSKQIKYTYDTYGRITQIQRGALSGSTFTEDTNQRTTNTYDQGTYGLGRLSSVQYYGGNCTGFNPSTGCDSFTEAYTYSQPGARLSKTVTLSRTISGTTSTGSLAASWTYDNEGRVTGVTYPSWTGCSWCTLVNGSHYTYAYDSMGRLNTMTNATSSQTMISGVNYGVANEMLQMTGAPAYGVNSETRTMGCSS